MEFLSRLKVGNSTGKKFSDLYINLNSLYLRAGIINDDFSDLMNKMVENMKTNGGIDVSLRCAPLKSLDRCFAKVCVFMNVCVLVFMIISIHDHRQKQTT